MPARSSPPTAAVRRVDASAVVTRSAAASRAGLGAIVRHARATRRLPTTARETAVRRPLSAMLPAPASLRRMVDALAGRVSVINHAPATLFPHTSLALARGLAWSALFGGDPGGERAVPADGRTERERALVRAWRVRRAAAGDDGAWLERGGAAWVASALYEADAVEIGRPVLAAPPGAGLVTPAFTVGLAYHGVVFVGANEAVPDWPALDRAATAAIADGAVLPPRPWFSGRLLVSDAWITERMAPAVLAEWATLTGRAGQADRYWYPESWERFLEPGRTVGLVSAAEVARSRPDRLRGSGDEAAAPSAAWGGGVPGLPLVGSAPKIERGVGVPPGYCLVDCIGTLAVTVARL